jgi:hypothetical protein
MQQMIDLTKELTPQAAITENEVERFRCALLNCDTFSIRTHPQWTAWVQQKNRLRGLSVTGEYKVDFKKMHQFRRPVLIITGTQTVAFHKRIDHLLAGEFTNAREVFVQSGHAVPVQAPAELTHALVEFLKQ